MVGAPRDEELEPLLFYLRVLHSSALFAPFYG